ncbi:MAG: hypothetical protein JOS17DRAFT_422648 [Linnemannia elongata]|nr:MAG: hypothetical protein JOS17DRAFT_422648 [Linnemannia elongata]
MASRRALPTQYTPDSLSYTSSAPSSPVHYDIQWSYDDTPLSPVSMSFNLPDVSKFTPVLDKDLVFEVTDIDDEQDSSSSLSEPESSFELEEHELPINPRNAPAERFPCLYPGCTRPPYATQWGLTVHQNTHNGVKFPCKSCSSVFVRHADRIRHQRSVHDGLRWKCDYCGKEYTRQSSARLHPCPAAGERGRFSSFRRVVVPAGGLH